MTKAASPRSLAEANAFSILPPIPLYKLLIVADVDDDDDDDEVVSEAITRRSSDYVSLPV